MKTLGLALSLAAALALPLAAPAADRPAPPIAREQPSALAELPGTGAPLSLVLFAGRVGPRAGCGSGVIVGDDRDHVTILTAAHVLAMARITATTVAGERLRLERWVPVPGHDLAVVTAVRPWRRYEVARMAPHPAAGTAVRLWGPVHDEAFEEQGAVVRPLDPRIPDAPEGAFAIDCPACGHGDSGTGVFTDRNELVGIVVAGYTAGGKPLLVLAERYAAP